MPRAALFVAAALAAAGLTSGPAAACDIEPVRLNFAPGSTALSADGKEGLDFYADLFPQYGPGRIMRLTAHTDTVGSAQRNRALAQARALAARAYLIGKGVPAGKIEIQNFGEERSAIALGDGRTAAEHRFVQVDILKANEARKGARARLGVSPCHG